jgi:hypothetical protein
MRMPSFAAVSPFARRAAAIAAAKAAEGDDDEDKKKTKKAEGDDEESDEDKKKSKKAEGDEDESDEDKKKSKKAEGDDDESDEDKKKSKKAEGDDEESDEDKKKSKKSKKAEDDDDDEPEARVSATDVARIRASERKRISAIVSSEAGLANPDAAYELAVNSDMPTANAIAMLRAVGPAKAQAPAKDKLRERMAGTQQPDIGAGGEEAPAPGDPKALAAAIINAGKKRRGEKD